MSDFLHPTTRACEQLYIYSDDDVARILGDTFVDLRDVMDDREAAGAIEIVHERLTDDFYNHRR